MSTNWRYDPADDLGLPAHAAMRSAVREPGLAGCLCTRAWWMVVSPYLRRRFGLTIEGRQRLADAGDGPYVIVANHASHLDALVLGAAAPWRLRHAIFPIAAGDVFFDTPTHAAFASLMLNALPMWRKNVGRHGLEQLRRRISGEAGRRGAFVLFPEGTRTRDGAMGRFKQGVGMLTAGTATPVYPAYIDGAYAAWPPGAARPARDKATRRITVTFGDPIRFADVPNDRAGWQAIAERLEHAVRELGRGHG